MNTRTRMPVLTETIAVRLSLADFRALVVIAQRSDRTISYVVRAHLDALIHKQPSTA